MTRKIIPIALTILFLASSAASQTTEFTYQGSLSVSGTAANGNYDFEFALYDAVSGGAQLGSTLTRSAVAVTAGTFSVQLDFGANFPGASRYLEIRVRPGGQPGITVLAPRQLINSSPYSVKSISADTALNATNATNAVNAATATNATQLNGQLPAFYLNATNFNAGTLNAARLPMPLTLSGTSASPIISGENASTAALARGVHGAATGASGPTFGVMGESASTSGTGVAGLASAGTGDTSGVAGQSDSVSGRGVYGTANSPTGFTYGVYGESASTSGRGVYGRTSANSGNTYAVYGLNFSASGVGVFGIAAALNGTTRGVEGRSESDSGTGVYGYAAAAGPTVDPTYGVYGASAGRSGRGVYGHASAGSGTTYGVYGESASTAGTGVIGWATEPTGGTRGVYGRSDSTSGRGVNGYASAASGTIYGVYGQASTAATGYAVYASGDMGASGVKPFRIDHPDDPENRYLLHYASESPEVINFYRGTVVLDGSGEALVELPAYFAKINRTPSYTLTAVGAPMPMLHVAIEIDEAALSAGAKAGPGEPAPLCTFRIAGGQPGAKVSWRIEAVRNDLWVRTRGTGVEVEKQGIEKGTYQHPELYGQPVEKGMNYEVSGERPKPIRPK